MQKKKILFLGESYRADAITWMNGLREFGYFEIITWELKTPSIGFKNRVLRILEFAFALSKIRKLTKTYHPDMVIAERTTSYGFLAALSGIKPVAIAQQGRTDLWPEKSFSVPLKKLIQKYAFKKADLIHAWGPVMTISMIQAKVDMTKVLVLPKGINLVKFGNENNANPEKICAIVTRSLLPEYRHAIILQSFGILNEKGIDFELTIIGDGSQLLYLKHLAKILSIENKVHFTGRIPNTELPKLLQQANIYISMPITEGVSASLFEAMATNCYPIVSDIGGNQSWIKHQKNGQLVSVDDFEMLAEELIWAFKNREYRENAVLKNREFVEQNADYSTNMKIIASKYHDLINANGSR
ncbi:glycosyltransferase [Flavobacterium caseinilyticum]|uniref:Glycosyltransferase n=1 Tax=Flavobacterium caseinilyticum TaxID=2541732 RepID=A0A4R5AWF3_9FLAO|nr:glycosyltransferase [Flavobacterium caseinilyticum]TDD76056.1 glycosyltransferase [Flavobacterium caseinilyticum]